MRISDWSSDVCSSDLPLAEAIARDGEQFLDEQPIPAATDMASLTRRGVKARVNGETVLIGKAAMFGRDGFAPLSAATAQTIARRREQGRTTMLARHGVPYLGALALRATPPPSPNATHASPSAR